MNEFLFEARVTRRYTLLTIQSEAKVLTKVESIVQIVVHEWENRYKLLEEFNMRSQKVLLLTDVLENLLLVVQDLFIGQIVDICKFFQVSYLLLLLNLLKLLHIGLVMRVFLKLECSSSEILKVFEYIALFKFLLSLLGYVLEHVTIGIWCHSLSSLKVTGPLLNKATRHIDVLVEGLALVHVWDSNLVVWELPKLLQILFFTHLSNTVGIKVVETISVWILAVDIVLIAIGIIIIRHSHHILVFVLTVRVHLPLVHNLLLR